ncbi:MAG: hypothetical protein COS68_04765 [Elusimicrobia bacterium CG06_land_8_20_14_3_00_38_11]|nr:MAG: hypothetical protein COS68_04765 [Elusimicrobia bacterium CG06_land_8_20_14_3_00_38_11]
MTKKDVGWSGWVEKTLTIPWEKYEKEKVSQWLNNTVNSVDGYKRIGLSGDKKTLTITVSDAWYSTPKFQKERIMEQTGKQFAGFSAQMGWRGETPDVDDYPTVIFQDIEGKRIGKHSTFGTKIYE